MKNIKLLAIVAVLFAATTHASAWSGSGTTDTPWLINSEDDWNELVTKVNGGESYYGKYFQLTEDISVTTMVGQPVFNSHVEMAVYNSGFCGTFDGGGHTITVEYYVCESEEPDYIDDWAAAPFRLVGHGAVLRNVHTKGTISGCIGFAAGLIGCVQDIGKGTIDVTVEHCRSSVDISVYTLRWGDYARPSDGGIIGSTTGWHPVATSASKVDEAIRMYGKKNIQLRDCVFDGSLSGNDLDTGLGGLVGSTALNVDLWFDGCVFAPSYMSLDHMETQSTFVHILREEFAYKVHFAHCYYVNNPDFIGNMLDGMNLQGERVYSIRGKSGVTTDFSGYELIPLYDDFKLVKLYKDASGFKGFKMGNALYAKGTETLSMHLEGSNAGYKASSPATLTGCENPYTLQMKNANCEISPAPVTITTASSELTDCMNGASKSIAFTNPNNYLIKWVLKRGDDVIKIADYASVTSPVDITSYLTEAGTYTFTISAKLSDDCIKEDVSSVSFEVYAAPTAKITSTPAKLSSCLSGEDKSVALSTYTDPVKWVLKCDGTEVHTEDYAAYTAPIEIPATYLTEAGSYTFTISAMTSHGCEIVNIDNVSFDVYAIPTATFDVVPAIKTGTPTLAVTLNSILNATKYDYWVENALGDRISSVGRANDVPATQKTITLTTGNLAEGTYTLYVLPKSETCDGQPAAVDIVVNNKPSITFGTEEIVVCPSAEKVELPFTASSDAVNVTYSVAGGEDHSFTLASHPSPLTIDVKGWTPGTYTVSAFASSSVPVDGDTFTKDFTILAPLTEKSVKQEQTVIRCGETYEATIEVNIFNAAGRKIYAHYTDGGIAYERSVQTAAADASVAFKLSGLKDVDASTPHPVNIYVEGFENCGITVYYDEPGTPKPEITALTVADICLGATTAEVEFTAVDAAEYNYYIVGQTMSSGQIAISGSTFDLPIPLLLTPGTYTLRMEVSKMGCTSEAKDATFTIYPQPTFEFTDEVAHDCYPSTSISVGYNSTDADTYSYTLTKKGAGSPAITVDNQSADKQGVILLNTTGLQAGTYELEVTVKSKHNCNITAPVTKPVTIHNQPTVNITSVESHCAGSAQITVNYTSAYASIYTYEVVGTTLSGRGLAEEDGSLKIDISSLAAGDYKLRMHVTDAHSSLTCEGTTDEADFTIWAVPEVGFVTPKPITEGTSSVTVTLTKLDNAETYDWRFMYGATELESGKDVAVASTNDVSLNTSSLNEGIYTLYVTPKTSHCSGEEKYVNVVVNNKPTINFGIPAIVCEGTNTLNFDYSKSDDATALKYAIYKNDALVDAEKQVDLAATSSPLAVDISTLTYGDYTLKGQVVGGEEFSVDFTLMAVPTLSGEVLQPKQFILCEDTYEATIVVNIFNAAGRKICAKYTDNGEHNTYVETNVGDETATLTLTGLTHTDLNGKHPVKVYVDGFEDCGITVEYDEPKLMTIESDFAVTALPKSCDEYEYTLTGTVFANCNEGTIVVEYSDFYYDEVPASTTGSTFTITDIPTRGGKNRLKAYFKDKPCSAVESGIFFVPLTPTASIQATMPATVGCDQKTFDLDFTLEYTWQGAGTLTVWVDGFPEKTYKSSDGDYEALLDRIADLNGTIEGLPADGREGVKLNYKFDAENSCEGAIDLPQFPRTPQITEVEIVDGTIPEFVPDESSTYHPEFTVSYDHTSGETLVLEYQKANGEWVWTSTKVSGKGNYTFAGLTFDDATMGERTIYVYFYGSTCEKKEQTYIAPSTTPLVPHVTISDIQKPIISEEYCDADDYTVTVTLNVTNARGNVNATCNGVSVEQPAEEGENTIIIAGVPRNSEPNTVELFFTNTGGATSDRQIVEFTQRPKPELVNLTIGDPGDIPCGADSYRLPVTISCRNLGTAALTMWLEDDKGNQLPQDGAISTEDETSAFVFTSTIDVPTDNTLYTLYVKAEGDNWHSGCNSLTKAIPAVLSPDSTSISLKPIDPLCDSEKEFVLPFALKQGDIAQATLTLTGSSVFNALMDINATNDTLTYTFADRLTAGKHTAIVEVRNAMGCVTTAELPIEVAQDSLIYSKWTEVLLIDNHKGLYTAYQWYENGQPVGNEVVLHVPGGMSGNTYYCLLTLRDGSQIYTCEHAFGEFQPSADHQQETMANTIAVQPNRVPAGGTVTVQQTAEETLHLLLTNATGQRVAEYTQTQSRCQIEMPALQGIYLLRIVSGSDMQTVKIVVY